MPRGELLELARALRELLRIHGEVPGAAGRRGPLFIVNDHLDIAMLSEADGVHLGPDDLSIAAARRIAGDRMIIGASASTPRRVREAVEEGADYLGCGPAFATPIKAEKKVLGPRRIAALTKVARIPVFAIGGIDASNVSRLVAFGLHRACVIRAVGDAPDPEQAARDLHAMLTATGR